MSCNWCLMRMQELPSVYSLRFSWEYPENFTLSGANHEQPAICAGLQHLDLAFVQPVAACLSSSLSTLTCLTFLALEGLLHLKQQGGYTGGAMVSLMMHLRQLDLQVGICSSPMRSASEVPCAALDSHRQSSVMCMRRCLWCQMTVQSPI